MNKKVLKIIGFVLAGILAFVAVVLLAARLYFRIPVRAYYKTSKKEFVIPELGKGFIAQGLSYDEETGNFFLTGYMADHSASPICIVNKETKKLVNTVRVENPDGTPFTGHAGGLSVRGDKIYVAGSGDCCFYVLDKNQVMKAEKYSSVKIADTVNLKDSKDGVIVSFTALYDDLIFAGEFYKDVVYPTSELHHIKSADGTNKALAVGYKLNGNTAVPEIAYSLPNEIQGMCFGPDGIYLTRSWGTSISNVYKFEYEAIKQSGTIEVLGKKVPLYILDSSNMAENYKAPPMAEEIDCVDGRFYIANESASNKYIFGKFTGGKWCYSTEF